MCGLRSAGEFRAEYGDVVKPLPSRIGKEVYSVEAITNAFVELSNGGRGRASMSDRDLNWLAQEAARRVMEG